MTEREQPISLNSPFTYEIRLEITPPEHFVMRKLPEPLERALGTASLKREVTSEKGILKITTTFSRNKRVMSAKEYLETNQAIRDYLESPVELLMFDHDGELAWAAGERQRSLQIFRDLALKAPKSVPACDRYARALLRAGLGASARKEVERGLSFAPDHTQLLKAGILCATHDLIGRELKPGWDRDATIRYLEALANIEKDSSYLLEAAKYAEHNLKGERYGKGADFERARAIYEQLYKEGVELSNQLQVNLIYSGQFEALLACADRLKDKSLALNYRVIALGALGKIEQATAEARSASPTERSRIFGEAADLFRKLGYYQSAISFYKIAMPGAKEPATLGSNIASLEKMLEGAGKDTTADTPEAFFGRLVQAYLNPPEENLLFSTTRAAVKPETLASFGEKYRTIQAGTRTDRQVLDVFMGNAVLTIDGNPELGYHVVVKMLGNVFDDFFIIHEQGALRLVAPISQRPLLAWFIQSLLEKQQLEAAFTWLDWVGKGVTGTIDAKDPLRVRTLQDVWGENQPRTAERALIATHLLMGSGDLAERALPHLLEAYAQSEAPLKWRLATAIIFGDVASPQQRLEITEALRQAFPTSPWARRLFLSEHLPSEPVKTRELLTEWLAEDPTNKAYLGSQQRLCWHLEGLASEERYVQGLEDKGMVDEENYNNLAWHALFEPTVPKSALDYGLKAARSKDPSRLHTLASLYAELGRCQEARATIDLAYEEAGEPSLIDWYVLGRIAEQYGDREAAIAAYQRFDTNQSFPPNDTSTAQLAARRLKALKVGK